MKVTELLMNPKQFIAITSLHVEEFALLLTFFAPICEKYFRYRTLEGKRRKIVRTAEHETSTLKGSDQKLFFLLVYLKTNALQEHQAASFGVSQTKVSRFSKILLELLNESLSKMGLMPYRDGELLIKQLAGHSDKVFYYDGTERGILRNSDNAAQEEEYSGKKKLIE
jgi:Helix-turn-helix of DDE superfamily endonuclease